MLAHAQRALANPVLQPFVERGVPQTIYDMVQKPEGEL